MGMRDIIKRISVRDWIKDTKKNITAVNKDFLSSLIIIFLNKFIDFNYFLITYLYDITSIKKKK